jgi:hypothetical protein
MRTSNAALQSRAQEQASPRNRVVYTYDVPQILHRGDDPVTSVGLVELSADEEMLATKRARNDGVRLAYELAKQSLVEVNSKPVSVVDGSSDTVWNRMSPQVRNLVLQAFAELHTPPEGAIEVFLKSRQARV